MSSGPRDFRDDGAAHTIHHRGQLLRICDVWREVPSIYGEAYDDAQARSGAGVNKIFALRYRRAARVSKGGSAKRIA